MSRLGRTPGTAASDSAVLDALQQGIQHTVLTRTRLRKGGQANKVFAPYGIFPAPPEAALQCTLCYVKLLHTNLHRSLLSCWTLGTIVVLAHQQVLTAVTN